MGPAGGSVRPALKGNTAEKYKALIISAEKGKARKEAVERQRAFAAAIDDEAVRSKCPTPAFVSLRAPRASLSNALSSPDTMTKFDKSKTGNLDKDELAQLMQHFAGGTAAPARMRSPALLLSGNSSCPCAVWRTGTSTMG